MKAQIKKAARDLFIQRGISDVSYGDIAEVVNTTRANLHYHFGNKNALVEAVFQEIFDSLEEQFQEVWAKPGLTLGQRIGHPEQRFGQNHQRQAFPGRQSVLAQEILNPADLAGIGPDRLDQPRGTRVDGPVLDAAEGKALAEIADQAIIVRSV